MKIELEYVKVGDEFSLPWRWSRSLTAAWASMALCVCAI